MRGGHKILAGVAGAALIGGAVSALAQETTIYSYDGLGRLTGSTIVGGGNNGKLTGTCFDRAGNRVRYDTGTTAPAICPTPTPTPTPAP